MTRADIRSVGCNCNNTLGQSLRFSCPADTCHTLEQLVRSIGVVVVVVVIVVIVVAVVVEVVVVVVVVVVVKKQAVVHITGPAKKNTV
jgi:hypothetical protein